MGKGYAQPRWRSAAAARLRYAYESTKTTRGTTDALEASNHLRSVAILDDRERDVLRCIRVILAPAPGTATLAWRALSLRTFLAVGALTMMYEGIDIHLEGTWE